MFLDSPVTLLTRLNHEYEEKITTKDLSLQELFENFNKQVRTIPQIVIDDKHINKLTMNLKNTLLNLKIKLILQRYTLIQSETDRTFEESKVSLTKEEKVKERITTLLVPKENHLN